MFAFISGRRIEYGREIQGARSCFGVARAPSPAKAQGLMPQIPGREYLDGWKPRPLDHQKVKVATLSQRTRQGWGTPRLKTKLVRNSLPSNGGLMLGQSIPTGSMMTKSAA